MVCMLYLHQQVLIIQLLVVVLNIMIVSISVTPVVPSGLAAVCALIVLLPWALSTRSTRRSA